MYFYSVYVREKERKERLETRSSHDTQTPSLFRRVIQVETAIRVSTRESTWKSETD